MTTTELADRYEWLTPEELKVLERKPWLVVFIEDDDESLAAARIRHRTAQKEARLELRKRGKEPHERMVVRGGIQTTAYVDPLEKEAR